MRLCSSALLGLAVLSSGCGSTVVDPGGESGKGGMGSTGITIPANPGGLQKA